MTYHRIIFRDGEEWICKFDNKKYFKEGLWTTAKGYELNKDEWLDSNDNILNYCSISPVKKEQYNEVIKKEIQQEFQSKINELLCEINKLKQEEEKILKQLEDNK